MMVRSPLRYPGGKAKLFDYISRLIAKNELYNCTYCEPYAGGSGLAIKLLASGFVERVKLNDLDPFLSAFWHSALYNTDEFCSLIMSTPVTIDEWRRQKYIRNNPTGKSQMELGFSTYFLNRTNRSGIIEGAGPIGGHLQKSKWKIDARYDKKTQVENFECLSKFVDLIDISSNDAVTFFLREADADNTFFYLDPPYFEKGSRLYRNFYGPREHKQIADMLLSKRRSKWIVSYDDVDEIKALYSGLQSDFYSLQYSIGDNTLGSEVLFVSDALLMA